MNNINKEADKFYVFTTESHTKDEVTEHKTRFSYLCLAISIDSKFSPSDICCLEAHNASCI